MSYGTFVLFQTILRNLLQDLQPSATKASYDISLKLFYSAFMTLGDFDLSRFDLHMVPEVNSSHDETMY